VAAVLAALLTAACAQPPPKPAARDTLELAVRADVTGIFPNPPIVNEAFSSEINRNIFEALVRLDGDLRLVPDLAVRWTNPAPDTYVFELKPSLRFSDGRPLTAEDVAASIEAGRTWVYRENFHSLASARALDRSRVELKTSASFPVLLTRLPWGLVVPKGSIGLQPVPPVGSGPYRLESRQPGREIVLVRNPHHAGPHPAFERVRFRITADDDARVQAVLSGQADAADQVPCAGCGSWRGATTCA
jgi:peptide/nickel transport system substrate-binding protein